MSQSSFASTEGIDFATRQEVGFYCTNGHIYTRTFSDEIIPPTQWDCPRCGSHSQRTDGTIGEEKPVSHRRSHWDMLRERRSMEELQQLLAERLAEIRAAHEAAEEL
jgi:hypothetical protein